jgi:hypothetical protein
MILSTLHPDLIALQTAYEKNGLRVAALTPEPESHKYAAYACTINGLHTQLRVTKVTPKKVGQFVTLWKRIGSGPIMPYDLSDQTALFIISARNKDKLGHFVFSKNLLYTKGYISKDGVGGKRAMRVYPPWDQPDNAQAKRTQAWQLPDFVHIEPTVDRTVIHRLFSANQ